MNTTTFGQEPVGIPALDDLVDPGDQVGTPPETAVEGPPTAGLVSPSSTTGIPRCR